MGRKMWDLAVLVAAIFSGYRWGKEVGFDLLGSYLGYGYPWLLWLLGGAIVGLPIVWAGKALAALVAADLAGNTSVLVRRPIGLLGGLATAIVPLVVGFHFAMLCSALVMASGIQSDLVSWLCLFSPVLIFSSVHQATKHRLGRFIAPLRRIWRAQQAGQGGSAAIAGLFEEWALMWRKGAIVLGLSLYDPSWAVGLRDDRHCLTIAGSRAGKGRAVIIPNLVLWPHSALVIDPKGQIAAITAARRGNGGHNVRKGLGQKVYALNPHHVNEDLPWMPRASRFNPLSILDPQSPTFYEDLALLADALIIIGQGSGAFFDASGQTLSAGLIGLAKVKYGASATLTDFRALLARVMDEDGLVIQEMLACGGVIADAAAQIASAEPKVRSSIVVTALQQTDWLSSTAMQEALSASDFSIFELKERPTTVFVILPPEYLDVHSRFMRLFVNLAIKAGSRDGRSKTPILFVLDEFYSLGPMPLLSKAMGNLAGYNIKVWPILQNLGQLIELFPQNWETFVSNAGLMQVFSINDQTTADYVTAKLGRKIVFRDDGLGNQVPAGHVDLRDRVEVTQEASRISGKQIIFREGEDPLVLNRINYDQAYAGMVNPDPDRVPRHHPQRRFA